MSPTLVSREFWEKITILDKTRNQHISELARRAQEAEEDADRLYQVLKDVQTVLIEGTSLFTKIGIVLRNHERRIQDGSK